MRKWLKADTQMDARLAGSCSSSLEVKPELSCLALD